MVVREYIVFILLAWLLAPVTGFGAAEPPLRAIVATSDVEFGKPIKVDLIARDLQPNLNTLDLAALDRDFNVETRGSVERDADVGQQRWRIHLYPRRTGELWVPSLSFHGEKTGPVKVMVNSAVDRKDGAPIQVSSEIGDTSVWINQAIRVVMQIESDSRYAWLETGTAQNDGLAILSLPHTRTTRVSDGKQRTLHRIGWVLYPQTPGTLTMQLPPVTYHRDGVITHRFYPPKIELLVRALPAFVPPTMPIGRMKLEATLPDQLFLVNQELAFLTLRVTSEGPPDQRSSALLRQLKSDHTVIFYPARELVDEGKRDTNDVNERTYQVPFAPKAMGLISLPSVRLQYFNPSTGKIETYTQSLGRFLSISQWVVYTVLVALMLVLYRVMSTLYRWAGHKYRVYRAYRKALYRLQQATTPQEFKAGLMEIADGECWTNNLTLAGWLERWMERYPRLSFVSESVHQLQNWLYSQTEATLEEVRPSLIDACYRRMPLLKIQALTMKHASTD